MAQCQGRTRKGDQCKRDAREGSTFCSIHQDQEVRAPSARECVEWDRDAVMKAAVGFALIGAILFFRLRR
ncbi:MAG TPA: hypothetical protein VLA43_19410 [Longimicrobiales bacterium]|nr:hypothetical protein [Longimicrobiales bacterium]